MGAGAGVLMCIFVIVCFTQERVWLRHQQHGDLDDTKLIDGLTGIYTIYTVYKYDI